MEDLNPTRDKHWLLEQYQKRDKGMDKKQALRETKELWLKLAKAVGDGKALDKAEIPGPWEKYPVSCPCCAYNKQRRDVLVVEKKHELPSCNFCPMYNQWAYYQNEETDKDLDVPCISIMSPYQRWSNVVEEEKEGMLLYDLEFFCRLVAELAQEALES